MPSIRTIFLFLRGIDQTGRAMEGAKKGLMTLEERQEALRHSTYRLLFGTAAFAIFGVMMGKVIAGLIEKTSRGTLLLDDFGNAWSRLSTKIGETLTSMWTPAIHAITDFMDSMGGNEFQSSMLSWGISIIFVMTTVTALGTLLMAFNKMALLVFIPFTHALAMGPVALFAAMKVAILGAAGALGAWLVAAAPVLAILAAIGIALIVLKNAWDWATGTPESRMEMQLRAGREAPTPLLGPTGYAAGWTPNLQNVGISIDMSNNTFPIGYTPEELGRAISQRIADELVNRGIMNIS